MAVLKNNKKLNVIIKDDVIINIIKLVNNCIYNKINVKFVSLSNLSFDESFFKKYNVIFALKIEYLCFDWYLVVSLNKFNCEVLNLNYLYIDDFLYLLQLTKSIEVYTGLPSYFHWLTFGSNYKIEYNNIEYSDKNFEKIYEISDILFSNTINNNIKLDDKKITNIYCFLIYKLNNVDKNLKKKHQKKLLDDYKKYKENLKKIIYEK